MRDHCGGRKKNAEFRDEILGQSFQVQEFRLTIFHKFGARSKSRLIGELDPSFDIVRSALIHP